MARDGDDPGVRGGGEQVNVLIVMVENALHQHPMHHNEEKYFR